MQEELHHKLAYLRDYLKELGSVAIAFSSGVDSTFLLKVAHEVLGDNVMAITVQSCSFPKRELNEAIEFCTKEKIRHQICQVDEMNIEGFAQNPPNRCYLCKHALFEKIGIIAKKETKKSHLLKSPAMIPGIAVISTAIIHLLHVLFNTLLLYFPIIFQLSLQFHHHVGFILYNR